MSAPWTGDEKDGDVMGSVEGHKNSDSMTAESAAVRALLQRAGRRPPVPENVAAEVKSAARAQWQWTLRVEQRRRRLRVGAMVGGVLAAAAALMVIVDVVPRSRQAIGPVATLETVVGRALAGAPALVPGTVIEAGQLVETSPDSRVVLRLLGGVSLRLDAGTRLSFDSSSQVELSAGAIYADTSHAEQPTAGTSMIAVKTPYGVARDIGTRFLIRVDSEEARLEVLVRDGRVELEHGKNKSVAGAGEALAIAEDGTLSRREIPFHGALWDWTLVALPAFDAEGRSLHEFLVWAAHEGGWPLRYGSPSVESVATSMTLHGSIDGLSLQEALDLTLLGTGLEVIADAQNGELVVSSK